MTTDHRNPAASCGFDPDGFLVVPGDWSKEVAIDLAATDGLDLTDAHWEVISFLRERYHQSGTVPTMREIRLGTRHSTRDLFDLFPAGGPLMQGVKVAGLPKPTGCK